MVDGSKSASLYQITQCCLFVGAKAMVITLPHHAVSGTDITNILHRQFAPPTWYDLQKPLHQHHLLRRLEGNPPDVGMGAGHLADCRLVQVPGGLGAAKSRGYSGRVQAQRAGRARLGESSQLSWSCWGPVHDLGLQALSGVFNTLGCV